VEKMKTHAGELEFGGKEDWLIFASGGGQGFETFNRKGCSFRRFDYLAGQKRARPPLCRNPRNDRHKVEGDFSCDAAAINPGSLLGHDSFFNRFRPDTPAGHFRVYVVCRFG
jgi:hypothetical protein